MPASTPALPEPAALTARHTHGIALRNDIRLIAHSEGRGWRDIYASLATERPWDATLGAVDHTCLVYCVHQQARVRRTVRGEVATALLQPRRLTIIPADVASHWQVDGRPDILLLYLRGGLMRRLARDSFGEAADRLAIIPRLAMVDPLLEQLALAVLESLRGGPDSAAYADSIAAAIAARLVSHHMALPGGTDPAVAPPARANERRMRHLVGFIEQALADDLSLEVLAAEAGLGPDRLVRAFRASFGETPHAYVMRRRVDRAKMLLRATDMPIAELALATGFSSQSHLTATFQRVVGVSPARYRRQDA